MISGDLTSVANYMSMIEGFAEVLQSEHTMRDTVEAMAELAGASFDNWADIQARLNPDRYHHVYEWDQIGEQTGRLWDIVIAGSGRERLMYFYFKPSHEPVPRLDDDDDTRRDAIFRWKAPVMESGQIVHIRKKPGTKVLAFPRGEHGGIGFGEGVMRFYLGNITEPYPGGREVVGAFGDLWETYWNTLAHEIITRDVVEYIQTEFGIKLNTMVNGLRRSRVQYTTRIGVAHAPEPGMKQKGKLIVESVIKEVKIAAHKRRDLESGSAFGI